jgi:hypothetical protein
VITRKLDDQGRWYGLLLTDDEDEDEDDDRYTRATLFFDEIDNDGSHCHPFLVVEIGTEDAGLGPDERGVTLEISDLAELHRELGEYLKTAPLRRRPLREEPQ